jgi:phosphopantothenoylcysteine decarboxylase/phosphopantothenate--cysteine ligase
MFRGKRILLVIGGGIAAYKSLDLIRRLRERGAEMTVVMSEASKQFVTPLTVASLAGNRIYDDLFSLTDEAAMGHIELSRSADLIVVAPATADLLAKMAQGVANDLASTLILATDTKVLAAPSMNVRMWQHKATRRNLTRLTEDGVLFVGPNSGEMACGEFGPGRMAEPLEIVAAIAGALGGPTKLALASAGPANGPLGGRRVLITSGPTHEAIDPVRFIANRSSGKQGHAIARAAREAGAQVVLVSGPVSIDDPDGVEVHHVENAREMLAAVHAALPADIFIAAAAVADWRVAEAAAGKIKKGSREPQLTLVENPDILAEVARLQHGRPQLVVGFAAETEKVVEQAQAKLVRKQCDLILANDVGPASGVFGGPRNTVHLVTRGKVESWPTLDKDEVARRLVRQLAALIGGGGP